MDFFFAPASLATLTADRRPLIIYGGYINAGDGLISSRRAQRSGSSCSNGPNDSDQAQRLRLDVDLSLFYIYVSVRTRRCKIENSFY